MQPEPVPPTPAVPVEEARPVEPPRPEAQPARKEAKPPRPVVAAPSPVVAEPVTDPVPAPPVPVAPPPDAAIEAQPASPPPAAAQASAPAPETLSRDQYRVQLIDEARRHKRYPALARENNWQGNVLVGVSVAANGRPTVTLRGSSGYDVLDRQALEMFSRAARAVPVPPSLRGK